LKAIRFFWGVSGPVSLCILGGLTTLWIAFLIAYGLRGTCEQSSSIIRKGSASVTKPVLSRDLPALRNALSYLRVPSVSALSFQGIDSIDREVFGNVMVGNPPSRFVYTCATPVEQMGLSVGHVTTLIDIGSFASAKIKEETASVVFFWLLSLVVIVIANYRSLRILSSVNESLKDLAVSNRQDYDVQQVLARAIQSVPRNTGTEVILGSLAKILGTLAEVAELKMRMSRAEDKARLARQVGHDIRSPLSALRILMSKSKNLSVVEQELLKSCYQRVEKVADDLLASAQQESASVEVVSAIEEVIREKQLQHPQVEWQFRCEAASLYSNLLKSDFQRMFSNAFNNSLEAHASRIVVTAAHRENVHIVSIADNGSGMPDEVLLKLQQGVQTTTKGVNHGLGLSHARKTLEAHGGRFFVQKSIWNGVEIRLELKSFGAVENQIPTTALS